MWSFRAFYKALPFADREQLQNAAAVFMVYIPETDEVSKISLKDLIDLIHDEITGGGD